MMLFFCFPEDHLLQCVILFYPICQSPDIYWDKRLTFGVWESINDSVCNMFYNILDPRLKYVNDSQVRVVLFTHECGFSRLTAHHSSCTITGKAKKKLPLFSETDFIRRMSPGCCKQQPVGNLYQDKRRRSYTTHNFQNCDIDDKLWFILSRNILRILCESSDVLIFIYLIVVFTQKQQCLVALWKAGTKEDPVHPVTFSL